MNNNQKEKKNNFLILASEHSHYVMQKVFSTTTLRICQKKISFFLWIIKHSKYTLSLLKSYKGLRFSLLNSKGGLNRLNSKLDRLKVNMNLRKKSIDFGLEKAAKFLWTNHRRNNDDPHVFWFILPEKRKITNQNLFN